jgi:non-heme chloroperoxidase
VVNIFLSVLVTAITYLVVAAVLVLIPVERVKPERGLDFDVLNLPDGSGIKPKEAEYVAGDGSPIFYRHLEGTSNIVVVLLHGSGTEGRYLIPLAQTLNTSSGATVVIPDLRGHRRSSLSNMGDIGYIGQFKHDLEDLRFELVARYPDAKVILGGHSSGGDWPSNTEEVGYHSLTDTFC